ncbi:MAG: carboxypeptidase regulatory-like domain-containing protein [Candidatus Cloacimonetes bacterium]|nr:carboxypeptidase regulatory-like domain-containing protein [Candidatus Cloacimonadota bacterium]
MQAGGVELASVPGTPINNMQTLEFTLPWTPTVVGETQLYGKVVMAGDLNPSNDETPMLTVVVMESGLLVAEIGNGTGTNTNTGAPSTYGTWYKAFRQQLLYTADEFYAAGAAPGLISALAFNVQDLLTCQAMPNYTIRLKNTDQTALGTAFEAGEYTTVWHNDLFMPVVGWNLHNLIEPFFWDGSSNLLVEIVTDMIPGSYSYNALTYLTPTSFASSLRFQSDSANGSTGTTGSTANSRTNARFFMILEDMGSMNGIVTAGGDPLPGAEIVVENTVFTTVSGADGTYNLPHVPVGTQTVHATKHGYNVVTHNVTIVEDQTTTQNFALALLPQVAVTGRIVGSDAPAVGIEGASITLSGYEAYSATTDANGIFNIPNVFTGHTYTYNATALGYAVATGPLVVGTTPVNMGDIIVNEVAFAPHGVVATQSADFQSVNVSWEAPVPGGAGFEDDFEDYADFAQEFGDWTTHDVDGSATYGFSGIQFPGSGMPMSYIVFNPSMTTPPLDHAPHSGDKMLACFASTSPPNNDWLITPQVMGGGVASFWAKTYMDYGLERFKVGVSTTGTAPADFTIISGGSYVEAPLEWTEFTYDLSAYSGQQIYVGVQCISNDVFIFLVDDFYVGDARIRTASDAIHSSTSTASAHKMGAIAERALVTPNPVKFVSPTPRNTTRALTGYKVYRLLAQDQANENNWTTLTTNTITPQQYADNAWGPQPSGVYKYAVKAVYTNDVMSPAAFSAEIHKGMMGTLSGTITEFGTDLPVAGVTITAGEYSGTSTATGAYSFEVYAGTYTVTASKAGYQPASQTNVVIQGTQTTTLDFVMTEITLPPGAVQATEAGANVNLTWMEPGTAGGEWIHYDSGENDDSIGTGGAADFDVAVRYPPSALTDYAGMSLHALKVWPAQAGTFTLKVWTGGTPAAPGTLVLTQPFTPVLDTYNMVELDNPVTITGNEELWFGYNCNVSSGYPAGVDAGPATEGFGNMMFFQGAWDTLNNLGTGLDYNWNIQGYVGYSAPDRGELIPLAKINQEEHNAERALTGYKVWRLLQGQEANESQWVSLTPNPISAVAFQDTGWNTLPDGTYKWAVNAVYTGGALSMPAFSNALERLTEIGTVAGFVRSMDNQPINGATVTTGNYSATTNATGAYSMVIPAGTHSLIASHPNYVAMTQTGVLVVTGQTTTVNFQLQPSSIILNDSFETYPDFATTFAPWTLLDVDGSNTYGFSGISFPGSGNPMSYIVFNPSMTTPPLTDSGQPHTGAKFAACFASTTAPNNDWLITPQISGGGELRFWAQTFMDYGLEKYNIGVSTTGTAPADFTMLNGTSPISVPLVWTEYVYDLAAYANQQIYVGIQCVSPDVFIFMVDDVKITGGVGNENDVAPIYTTALKGNYPNPFNPETTISFSVKDAGPVNIEIYNVKGQLVKKLVNDVKAAGEHTVVWNGNDNNGRAVSSGVYYYKMNAGKFSSTKKMIMMK